MQHSFNKEFCEILEYHLSKTLRNSSNQKLKFLWCDGIKLPFDENQIHVNIIDSKQIVTNAYIGLNGQDNYEMIINFGACALDKYIHGSTLVDCLPNEESTDWLHIDLNQKTIRLQLN